MKVVVKLGQVSVESTVGPDSSQLNCVLWTLAGFLIFYRILDAIVTFSNSAGRSYTAKSVHVELTPVQQSHSS